MTVWILSTVLQWAVIGLLVVLVLALLRQMAVLSARLDRPVELNAGDGPSVGRVLDEVVLPTLDGSFVLGGRPDAETLVVFASPSCEACRGLPAAVDALVERAGPDLAVLLVVKGSAEAAREFRGRIAAPVETATLAGFPAYLAPRDGFPFAFSVARGAPNVVAARGVPASADDLSALLDTARRHAPVPI